MRTGAVPASRLRDVYGLELMNEGSSRPKRKSIRLQGSFANDPYGNLRFSIWFVILAPFFTYQSKYLYDEPQ